jgi:uncharacterized protein YmfQ (DUF2313 family)
MSFTSENYRDLIRSLCPKGKAWVIEPGTNLYNLLWAFADEFSRVDARGDDLINEADPRSTNELIEEWEAMVGLPDDCTAVGGSLQQRRDNIVARLTETGSLSKEFFMDIAEKLGYNILIKEFFPFRIGMAIMGDAIFDPDFQFVWEVVSPAFTEIPFYVGSARVGDYIMDYEGSSSLECIFNVLKPAQTNVFFIAADAVAQDGNPATGAKGTQILSIWLNDFLKNVLYVIQQAGTGLTDGDRTDLYDALKATESTAFLVEHNSPAGTHKDVNASSLTVTAGNRINLRSDASIFSQLSKKITLDDGAAGDLDEAFIKAVLTTLSGDLDLSGGKRLRLRTNASIYSNASKEIIFDDTGGGNLTEIDLKTALLTLAGNMDMATGKYIYAPDVAAGAANSGKFFGGNGGFMWFYGASNGTTAVTLDSTLDWRDRLISVSGILYTAITPSNIYPGGSGDSVFSGYSINNSGSMDTVRIGLTYFYSEAGGDGSSTPRGIINALSVTVDKTMYMYADSSTGDLKVERDIGTGDEVAYGFLVMFSDDQGHI